MVRLRVWLMVAAIVIVCRSLALAQEPVPATQDDPRSQTNSFGRLSQAFVHLRDVSQRQERRGTQQDDLEAVESYRKTADQNDAQGQFKLGWMYAEGRGAPRDDAEAVKWYCKAAEQNDAQAQSNLGWMYHEGGAVPQDYAEVANWYRKAAAQDDARAQVNLGWMYREGRGVPQDDVEAVKWYRKAAEQNLTLAQSCLGNMYHRGRGVPQDDLEAANWYRKAAAQGDVQAKIGLFLLGGILFWIQAFFVVLVVLFTVVLVRRRGMRVAARQP